MTSDSSKDLEQRMDELHSLGESVCNALSNEVQKVGLHEAAALTAPWEQCNFELQTDPASGETSLVGTWKDQDGHRIGGLVFHYDGSFFAEYDVCQNHPDDKRWFIEAVNAWGKNEFIKAEPRLLPTV